MTVRREPRPADPVFLDRTGRRRRLFVAAGSAGGLALLLAVLALVTGFTGTGPGSVPGWPDSGDELRVTRPETAVPVRSPARRTPAPPPPTRTRRTAAPVTAATTTPAPTITVTTSATPSASGNPHRRVPTHTPRPHKSKDK